MAFRLPAGAEVRARLRPVLGLVAIPGWLALVLSVLRSFFTTWAEVDFAWQKLEPAVTAVVQFLWSPVGLFLAGIAWLTVIAFRPVRVDAPLGTFAQPSIQVFDGRHVMLLVTNRGTATTAFQALATIEEASFDFKLRHPFVLPWTDESELDAGRSGRVLVAEYDDWNEGESGNIYIRGAGGSVDMGYWYLEERQPSVRLRIKVTIMGTNNLKANEIARNTVWLELDAHRSQQVITASVLETPQHT